MPCSELSEGDVRTAIKNTAGVRGTLMLPDAPFELLVRRAISRLLTPALQCKEFVHSELLRIAGQCAPPDIARFPSLQVKPCLPRCLMVIRSRSAGSVGACCQPSLQVLLMSGQSKG